MGLILRLRKYEQGLSNASVKKIYAILNSALNKAVLSDLIIKNPLKGIELSDVDSEEVHIFTKEEQSAFQNAIKGSYFYELFMTSLFTGLRIGEVTALKWENVDLENSIIKVRLTSARVKNYTSQSDSKTTISLQTPKTKASIRSVPTPKPLLEILKMHRISQQNKAEAFRKNNMSFNEQGFVFCTVNGNIIDNRNVMRAFHNILKKNSLPDYNLHSLRHTYASRLLEKGYSLRHISELLGHKDVAFTARTYAHVLPEELKKSVDSLEDLF